MQYRNAKIIGGGKIDCEIDHPDFGWIPFTCDADDDGATFDVAALHAEMLASPSTIPYTPPTADELLMQATQDARSHRAYLLTSQVDPIATNPLRWGSLTQAQQDEIAAYRTALLDITDQSGFPESISWPPVPQVLA